MAHVTLSIPDDLYENMKRYPEIRWSEIIRQTISLYLEGMKDTSSSEEIRNSLSQSTLEKLRTLSSKKAGNQFRKSVRQEWKRARSLTPTS